MVVFSAAYNRGNQLDVYPLNGPSTKLRRAAQYLRMSTEHQQYSITNQSAAIALYAAAHNIGIVRSFNDEARSGMTIKGRRGLQHLLQVVQAGEADFDLILVYDVSRWGRFQDADEAAHYEFLCKRAGVDVRYCAEQFENDNSTTSNLLKALKRTMAGEYSRELSVKVLAGQRRIITEGFRTGSAPPYGFRRLAITKEGKRRRLLKPGEWKNIHTDRVILVPGPKHELAAVSKIFDLFTEQGKSRTEIVEILNREKTGGRSDWRHSQITYMLENPVYIGTNVFCRHDFKTVRTRKIKNPPALWAVCEGAFQPIISRDQFKHAQQILKTSRQHLTNEKMLEALRKLWKRRGKLNSGVIKNASDVPSLSAYYKHFGGLTQAYRLIGFTPSKDYSYTAAGHSFKTLRYELAESLAASIRAVGGSSRVKVMPQMSFHLMVNDEISLRIMFARPRKWPNRATTWPLCLTQKHKVDILIVARVNPSFCSVLDYYVIPHLAELRGTFHINARNNAQFIDLYRFDDLQTLVGILARVPIPISE